MQATTRGIGKMLRALDELLDRALQWAWRHRRALGALAGLVVAVWVAAGPDEAEVEDPAPGEAVVEVAGVDLQGKLDKITNHLWVDRLPKNKDQTFRMYFLLNKKDAPKIGVHITFHSMTYRTQEFFTWEAKKKALTLQYFDPEVKAKVGVATLKPIKDKQHVDMKLVLDRDPQVKGVRYGYLRLKQDSARALGLPDVAALEAMALASTRGR